MDGKEINGYTVGALLRDAADPHGRMNAEFREGIEDADEILGAYPALACVLRDFAGLLYVNMCSMLGKPVDKDVVNGLVQCGKESFIQYELLCRFLGWWTRLNEEDAIPHGGEWADFKNVVSKWLEFETMLGGGDGNGDAESE